MRRSVRWLAVAAGMALILPLATEAAAGTASRGAVSGPATGHATVMTRGNSPFFDRLAPLVGSAKYLVYANYGYPEGVLSDLSVRSRAGTTTRLPQRRNVDIPPDSLAGGTLTGEDDYVSQNGGMWWNLTAGTTGVARFGYSVSYLGAAPDGVVAMTGHGELVDYPTAGGPRIDLGTPFPSETRGFAPEAVSGDDGIVLVDNTLATPVVKFMAWSTPGTFTTLDTTGVDSNMFCSSEIGDSAGCDALGGSGHPQLIVRLSTSGAAPVITTLTRRCAYYVYVTPTVTAWPGCGHTLDSVPAATGTPISSGAVTNQEQFGAVGAYDRLVVENQRGRRLALISEPSAVGPGHPVVAPKPAPIFASHVALTTGRVAYQDDQVQPVGVASRTISAPGTHLSVGAAKNLGTPVGASDLLYGGEPSLSISGANTAATADGAGVSVWTPFVRRIFRGNRQDVDEGVDLSGDRLVYDSEYDQNPVLADLTTGKSRPIRHAVAAAVWGDYLAYAKSNGSIWRRPLSGHGKPVELRGPVNRAAHLGAPYVELVMSGDVVAWWEDDPGPRLQDRTYSGFRNAATMRPAISLHGRYRPLGVTSNGVFADRYLKHNRQGVYERRFGGGQPHRVLTIKGGGQLFGEPGQVAVSDGQIAWIDNHDRARIASLRHSRLEPPRYLGDPSIPTLHLGSEKGWRGFVPLSSALTKCSITITQHGVGIRTLPCRASDKRLGDAAFRWEGKTTAGTTVSRGRYRWVLSAGNAAGPAVAADGSASPISGSIRVR